MEPLHIRILLRQSTVQEITCPYFCNYKKACFSIVNFKPNLCEVIESLRMQFLNVSMICILRDSNWPEWNKVKLLRTCTRKIIFCSGWSWCTEKCQDDDCRSASSWRSYWCWKRKPGEIRSYDCGEWGTCFQKGGRRYGSSAWHVRTAPVFLNSCTPNSTQTPPIQRIVAICNCKSSNTVLTMYCRIMMKVYCCWTGLCWYINWQVRAGYRRSWSLLGVLDEGASGTGQCKRPCVSREWPSCRRGQFCKNPIISLSVLIVLIVVSSPLVCWISGHNLKLRFLRQSYPPTNMTFGWEFVR